MSEPGKTEMRGSKEGWQKTDRVIGLDIFRALSYDGGQKSELRSKQPLSFFPSIIAWAQSCPPITALRPAELQSYFVVAVNGADDSGEDLYARWSRLSQKKKKEREKVEY